MKQQQHSQQLQTVDTGAQTVRRPPLLSHVPLSQALWGVDLRAQLPLELGRGLRAVPGEVRRLGAFLQRHYPSLTQEALGSAPNPRMAAAKRQYLETLCDCIELRLGDETVGALLAEPEDWSTYYLRSFAVARAHQHPALLRRFARQVLEEPLTARGVERVVSDTSPLNAPMNRFFCELGFHPTGQHLTDRWGPMVRYTKFLDPACADAFREHFGGTAPPRALPTARKEEP